MGFEPFIPPKRIISPDKLPTDASREDRIKALAQLLHGRGITSSIADARRLAEGMVDVEKKVMKSAQAAPQNSQSSPPPAPGQAPALRTTETPTSRVQPTTMRASDMPGAQHAPQKQSFGLSLPEEFMHFVAQAAAISHEHTTPCVEIPQKTEAKENDIMYGRGDDQHTVAHVPHVNAHKQVMFEDAPPITQARGYNGPKPREVDFTTQKENVLAKLNAASGVEPSTPAPATHAPATSPTPVTLINPADDETTASPQTATTITASSDGVKVTRTESTPTIEIVEERMLIEDEEPFAQEKKTTEENREENKITEEKMRESERAADNIITSEPPVTTTPSELAAPKEKAKEPQREDLAKKHGVDIFQMFKTKT